MFNRRAVSKRTLHALLTVSVGASVLFASAESAAASDGCGPLTTSLDGILLLNDGISNTAGPFSLVLPAGTYDITMRSWDNHDEHYQPDQEHEQWYFTLDSGYSSPPSIDIPTEQNSSVTVLPQQDIEQASTITLHHVGLGNVNSVLPVCVGFDSVDSAPATPVETVPELVPEVVPEVEGAVELPAPSTQLAPPLSVVAEPPTRVQAASTTPSPPQLALTGPTRAGELAVIGTALLFLGFALSYLSITGRRRPI